MRWPWRRPAPAEATGPTLGDLQQEVRRVARQLLLAEARWEAMERGVSETRAVVSETRAAVSALRDQPPPPAAEAGALQLVLAVVDGLDGLEQAAGALTAMRAGAQETAAPADREALLDVLGRVHRHILRALFQAGVQAVPAEGAPFDPRVHRAVGRVEAPGHAGQVVAVDRRGYAMDGRVVRYAEVVVGADPAPDAPAAASGEATAGPSGR